MTAYDVVTRRPVRTFGGIGEAPVTAAMGPDGDTPALAQGRQMELWSLRTGKRLGGGRWGPEEMKGDGGRPDSMEFSPGGGYIVVRDNIGGPYVALWNVARRAPQNEGGQNSVQTNLVCPAGLFCEHCERTLAVGAEAPRIHLLSRAASQRGPAIRRWG